MHLEEKIMMLVVFATTFLFFFVGGGGIPRHLAVQTDLELVISGPTLMMQFAVFQASLIFRTRFPEAVRS